MSEEVYILLCPECGRVEGFAPDAEEDHEETAPAVDEVIDEEVVNTPSGPTVRIRCPQCGLWIKPDHARPA